MISNYVDFAVGKLPASQANPEVVSAFRMKEKDDMKKLLDYYLSICSEAKVIFDYFQLLYLHVLISVLF